MSLKINNILDNSYLYMLLKNLQFFVIKRTSSVVTIFLIICFGNIAASVFFKTLVSVWGVIIRFLLVTFILAIFSEEKSWLDIKKTSQLIKFIKNFKENLRDE